MFEDLKEDEIFVILCSSDNPFTFSLKSRSRSGYVMGGLTSDSHSETHKHLMQKSITQHASYHYFYLKK